MSVRVRAGQYRHRITVKQLAGTDDDYGEPNDTHTTLGKFWANVTPIKGQEIWQGQQVKATTTHGIEMRWENSITPPMQVIHRGRTLEIEQAINVEERDRKLLLLCTEVVD